jgi:hypothetical protein
MFFCKVHNPCLCCESHICILPVGQWAGKIFSHDCPKKEELDRKCILYRAKKKAEEKAQVNEQNPNSDPVASRLAKLEVEMSALKHTLPDMDNEDAKNFFDNIPLVRLTKLEKGIKELQAKVAELEKPPVFVVQPYIHTGTPMNVWPFFQYCSTGVAGEVKS